jgi:tricorn protease
MAGRDAQLEAGVNYLMGKLKNHPVGLPARPQELPAYPKNGQPPGPSL